MLEATPNKILQSNQCGKNRYAHKRLAQEVFNKCQRRSKRPRRIYECPDCAGWHLTACADKSSFNDMAADGREIGRIKRAVSKNRTNTKLMAELIRSQLQEYYTVGA